MRFIKDIFTRHFSRIETSLGRWDIKYDTNIIDTKIDQANQDHCGCCEVEKDQKPENIEDKYFVPFMI